MKNLVLLLLLPQLIYAQNYDSYFTGNVTDIQTQPNGGVCLMGGATEDDNAMIWFLEQANGGDILVLRASGADGYNAYFYTDLGVTVNSVESIVFNDATASEEAYIQQKIQQAEAIWFAGGDQWNYVSYWRNTAIDSLINLAISERNIVIGGTSAGMAILGAVYFTAENGTVTSATALNNPYATTATIDSAHFLDIPYMNQVITDTHYDNPDRRGRHFVFLGRMLEDYGMQPYGIACEEYVAVCVDTSGIAHVYGGYPTYDEQAYFIRPNCDHADTPTSPEVCSPGMPFTWSANQNALAVYKINGTSTGANYFDLNTWQTGSGGEWYYWYAESGTLGTTLVPGYECILSTEELSTKPAGISVYPNPTHEFIYIDLTRQIDTTHISIYDVAGNLILSDIASPIIFSVDLSGFADGVYLMKVQNETFNEVLNVIKR
ncbi:MAG: T9SS type A sorting domain-containing protein [Bacteroidetes bacterium]|nr:T9SS type A sorting domain-containing protein [Bacteroidota bacterium]